MSRRTSARAASNQSGSVSGEVWVVLETKANASSVVAVTATIAEANIVARVRKSRWGADSWRVLITGPHEINHEYSM